MNNVKLKSLINLVSTNRKLEILTLKKPPGETSQQNNVF